MKRLILLAAMLTLAAAPPARKPAVRPATAPASPAVAGDWASYVRVSPQGSYIVGNPRAGVKLVEYLSYTCPHCAAFTQESAAVLRGKMINAGTVEVEYRPAVRDAADLAATLLVRCAGPARFTQVSEAIFARQDDWLPPAYGFLQNDAHRFSDDPVLEQLKITAQLSGLSDVVRGQGLTPAEIDRCFTDEAGLKQIVALGQASQKVIKATPSFFINGAATNVFEWSKLEPLLRAKGAR